MEYTEYILLVVVVLFLTWRFLPAKGITQITTRQLKDILSDKSYHFVDVRTSLEFSQRKIKGFRNIPLSELTTESQLLDKSKPVVVICQSGMRSTKAAKLLKKQGFKNVINVKGGMSAW